MLVSKKQTKKDIANPPGGMECGCCVAHMLSLLLNFTMWWKTEVKCTLILEKGSKSLQDYKRENEWKKGMKEGLFGVLGDLKHDVWLVCLSHFL